MRINVTEIDRELRLRVFRTGEALDQIAKVLMRILKLIVEHRPSNWMTVTGDHDI